MNLLPVRIFYSSKGNDDFVISSRNLFCVEVFVLLPASVFTIVKDFQFWLFLIQKKNVKMI